MTTQITSSSPRTYQVITYGCQMNEHDSERIAGLLEQAGLVAAPEPSGELADADVVVFNTCAVRENADNRLYGNLGHMARIKRERPGMQIAVGGCMAQKDRDLITTKAPWVDVVFGTNNVGSLPVLLERARITEQAQVEIKEALQTFPSNLPTRRDSACAALVPTHLLYRPQPAVRDRPRPGEILREISMLVDEGVQEITLLGQNVNTYGVEFGDRSAFAQLLRSVGQVDGLERVRFTSPHPASFTNDVIEAMAETHNVMPSLHMPLQSGSDAVLRAMRRSYRKDRFLRILDDVRAAMPHAAITTDIIVGFPGETEADFAESMRVVEASRFAAAFTFQYSIRPGTPAATMPDQIPAEVVQERYERLVAEIEQIAWEENTSLVGSTAEVLFAAGEGRKDQATTRITGRARDNRLVHVAKPDDPDLQPRPGDIAEVTITRAAPHHWSPTPRSAICAAPGAAMPGRPPSSRVPRGSVSDCPPSRSAEVVAQLPLIVLIGPTASGKSSLAIRLATLLAGRGQPAEIVNADSMLVYRGMDIGTAKPTAAELAAVRHHLVDIMDITEAASVAEFQSMARAAIDRLLGQGVVPILVGGSSLYISSIVDRFDFRAPTRSSARNGRTSSTHQRARAARCSPSAASAAEILPGNGGASCESRSDRTHRRLQSPAAERVYAGRGSPVRSISTGLRWTPGSPPGRPDVADGLVRDLAARGLREGLTARAGSAISRCWHISAANSAKPRPGRPRSTAPAGSRASNSGGSHATPASPG